MISFHNERLASPVLCKLLYDAVPDEYHVPVIFSYGRWHMPYGYESCLGVTNYERVWLNLKSIADCSGTLSNRVCCSESSSVWYGMLRTGFHEFGHIAHNHADVSRCRVSDRHVEEQASDWAFERIAAVLRWDDRLFQPRHLGVVDIVRQRHRRGIKFDRDAAFRLWGWLWDWRCHITGGQLSVGDVIRHLNLASRDRPLALRHYQYVVHRLADDLARVHVDEAGRKHHFWTWGDLTVIARRYATYRAESEREAKWEANYDAERDREIYDERERAKYEAMCQGIQDDEAMYEGVQDDELDAVPF